jgi:DNA gyrase/topoisomerase IV subunit A
VRAYQLLYDKGFFIRYTQKQIDKFNRQKYITELEKISKNLFRMLRDENVCSQSFMVKFEQLKKKFDEKAEVQLDSEYHQQLKVYIERLYQQTCSVELFCDISFNNIREAEMSNLNRLQKLKNGTSYKKDKHKSQRQNEDWG